MQSKGHIYYWNLQKEYESLLKQYESTIQSPPISSICKQLIEWTQKEELNDPLLFPSSKSVYWKNTNVNGLLSKLKKKIRGQKSSPQNIITIDDDKMNIFDLFVYGARNAGKTTLLKTLRLQNDIPPEERRSYIPILRYTCLEMMGTLLIEHKRRGYSFDDHENKERANIIINNWNNHTNSYHDDNDDDHQQSAWFSGLALNIHLLWKEPSLQQLSFSFIGGYDPVSCQYHFSRVMNYSTDDYVPDNNDILRVRDPHDNDHLYCKPPSSSLPIFGELLENPTDFTSALPHDILLTICMLVNNPTDIFALSLTNKKMHEVIQSPLLWKSLLKTCYPNSFVGFGNPKTHFLTNYYHRGICNSNNGVEQTTVTISRQHWKYRLCNVQHQNGEMRKWIHYFEQASLVIVIDMSMFVNPTITNDQQEDCFTQIERLFSSRYFTQSIRYVLLNKWDVFQSVLDAGLFDHSAISIFTNYLGSETPTEESAFVALNNAFRKMHNDSVRYSDLMPAQLYVKRVSLADFSQGDVMNGQILPGTMMLD